MEEELKKLRIKKQMLQIEFEAEMQAMDRKIKLLESLTTVTNIPVSESSKSKAIPEQTAPGKESTNPLIADALLKSITKDNTDPNSAKGKTSRLVDNTSPTAEGLSKMTILSSNNLVQDRRFVPDYLGALKDNSHTRYYVIYNGPHKGVHTDWGLVDKFCKEQKTTSRKFRTKETALFSLATVEEGSSSKPLLLRPKTQKAREEHRDQRFTGPKEIPTEVEAQALSCEDFRLLWSKARAACSADYLSEKFYTTDKKSKSLYNFMECADPLLVHQAFQAGLVQNIYPSSNLQELKFFPARMVESIKNFRRKVLKAKDEPLYINVVSSIPDWQQENRYAPYYFLEIGLAKNKKELEASQPMEDKDLPFLDILHTVRINGLKRIAEKILDTYAESKKKINYASKNCIITSWSYNNTNEEDMNTLFKFGEKFMKNSIEASTKTKQSYCRHAAQLFQDHKCKHCGNNTESGPSTEEDVSSVDKKE